MRIIYKVNKMKLSSPIPEEFLDLFQKKAFAHIATIMPDGSPQVTPVWVDYDGNFVIVNSIRGRQKDRNVRKDNRVALSIQDPDNPYRYIQLRGTIAEITEEGAEEHIDRMAKKYLGVDKHPFRKPGQKRVIYKISVEHITSGLFTPPNR